MYSDRELLELAAKAAGINVDWRESVKCFCYSDSPYNVAWNPLGDDGDALRLAVALRLLVNVSEDIIEVLVTEPQIDISEPTEGDSYSTTPYSATRRAIVRAAVEIQIQRSLGEILIDPNSPETQLELPVTEQQKDFLDITQIPLGSIWLAADGGVYGVKVADTHSLAEQGDVVVQSFHRHGVDSTFRTIDSFKLQYRYYRPDVLPEWVPEEIQ